MTRSVRDLSRGWRWGHLPSVPRDAVAHIKPEVSREFPTEWARNPAVRAVRDVAQAAFLAPLVRRSVRLVVTGRDRVVALENEPCVFVANHSSHLDTAALLTALPTARRRRTAVVAAADYFFDDWRMAVGTAVLFGTVPIDRRGRSGSETGISELPRTPAVSLPARLLADGWSLLVFPEGTRSPDGWAGEWRTGASRLAIENNIPLVPVALRGSFAAMPRGKRWPARGRPPVHVRFGPPLRARGDEDHRSLTVRARAELLRLADEDSEGWYSSLRRAASGQTPDGAGPVASRWRRSWEVTRPPARPDRPRVWR
jgi:1-acyl-sn-glycerol-3-phosphate acyltransferase